MPATSSISLPLPTPRYRARPPRHALTIPAETASACVSTPAPHPLASGSPFPTGEGGLGVRSASSRNGNCRPLSRLRGRGRGGGFYTARSVSTAWPFWPCGHANLALWRERVPMSSAFSDGPYVRILKVGGNGHAALTPSVNLRDFSVLRVSTSSSASSLPQCVPWARIEKLVTRRARHARLVPI
jgi:hypothetical protein